MHHAEKTVTVYRKKWDAEKMIDTYQGRVLRGVSFFSKVSTTISTDGMNAACEGFLRVPMEKAKGLEIRPGDLVCEGKLSEACTAISELKDNCPYVYTVVGVTYNTIGQAPHIKAVCM